MGRRIGLSLAALGGAVAFIIVLAVAVPAPQERLGARGTLTFYDCTSCGAKREVADGYEDYKCFRAPYHHDVISSNPKVPQCYHEWKQTSTCGFNACRGQSRCCSASSAAPYAPWLLLALIALAAAAIRS